MDKKTWQQVEVLFHQAIDLPEHERDEFLQQQCQHDTGLLNAVRSLLQHTDRTDDLYAVVASQACAILQPKDLIGQAIGNYRIIQPLGHGGMGSVYLAERADQQFDKRVAIKLIRTVVADPYLLRAFKAERQILADLEHAYISRLLDGGATDDNLPYLVMEYVEGIPIDEYCQQKQLSLKQRLQLFRKVCSAVEFAHQKMVVHCDLKPSNILITEQGEPRLLDFGIAKLLHKSALDELSEQQLASSRATLNYCSPEQLQGKALTTVTDVYALGVILFELLTAARPFLNSNTATEKREAILQSPARLASEAAQGEQEQPRDSGLHAQSPVRSHGIKARQLRGDLDSILTKALQKNSGDRYASVAALSDDIERFLSKRVVLARPGSWSYRAGRFLARNRISSALSALVVVTLLSGSSAVYLQSVQVAKERDFAELQREKADAINRFITDMLSSTDPMKAQGHQVTVREVLDQTSQQLTSGDEHSLQQQPLVEASVRLVIGRVYNALGLYRDAERHLEQALHLQQKHQQLPSEEYVRILSQLASAYSSQYRFEEAMPLTEQALAMSQQVLGHKHRLTLGMMGNLAGNYQDLGKLQQAKTMYLQLHQLRLQVLGDQHPDIVHSLTTLGIVHYWLGDYPQTELYFRQCLELGIAHYGERHERTLNCLSTLASVLVASGQYQAAEPYLLRHIELSTLVVGPHHPATLRTQHNLAMNYRGQGRYDESEQLFLNTLSKRRQTLGDDNIETLQTQMRLAILYRDLQRLDEAVVLASDTAERQAEQLGESHPTTLRAWQVLAGIYFEQHRQAQALALYHQILQNRQAQQQEHPENIEVLITMARIYRQLEQSEQSVLYLQQAKSLARQHPDHEYAQFALTTSEN
ncbi:tetratricopeptide repeat protein [Alkalimonas collagenimarina]|uniref:Tetratricopeptide repeat protein n=1 Tax=Alkalimonas collagenimarina TaxID=400390 RepID=A0ABT9GWQ6_9GAMM|nr:tetratricopeptide repeat protein [Alkalimonas collagenimarina]MDP4535484.1 tetratricopeptide repeat protein [Alkalimonas collagenimarina]